MRFLNVLFFYSFSASPINDISSESGSESTSPDSSSEESNNGSLKVDTAPTENSKWSLSSFIKNDLQTKAVQPLAPIDNQSQQQQPPPQQQLPQSLQQLQQHHHQQHQTVANIKNEPMSLVDDESSNYNPTSNTLLKDAYQNNLMYETKSNNNMTNCDIPTEQIKQEPIGIVLEKIYFFRYF